MENLSFKSKKSRRKRRHRSNRGRSSAGTKISGTGNNSFSNPTASLVGSGGMPSSFSIPGQSNWFWENYRQVMDWQGRHQVAYWKSRALALECQNSMLIDYVENMNYADELPFEETTDADQEEIYQEEHSDESLVFEVNEEMLAFFQQSITHKQEMKKQKEAERMTLNSACDSPVFPQACNEALEGSLLYGEAAPRILALETSMQLNFERFVDRSKPQLWPNIPLNL